MEKALRLENYFGMIREGEVRKSSVVLESSVKQVQLLERQEEFQKKKESKLHSQKAMKQ